MKLNTHLMNEAIILPDMNAVKQVQTALYMIHDQWLKMARVNTGQKLHKFINKELQSKRLNVIVQFKSDPSVANTVQGEAGSGNIMLVHSPDHTLNAWEYEFQSWLKVLTETLKHELVHVEQIKRIKAANTDELIKILDGISAKFADYDKRKAEWVIRDWDKYLSSGTEIMAHAQSAASAVLQGTDNPYLRRKGVAVPSPSKIIEMAKSKSGISTLANLSRHFNGYYKLRHYLPKVWKKFMRYFVDYIQSSGEGVVSELFKSDIPIKVAPTRRKRSTGEKRKLFYTTFNVDNVDYYFEAAWQQGAASRLIPKHDGYFDVTFGVRFAPKELELKGGLEMTGLGKAPRVLAAVIKSFERFIEQRKPEVIRFAAIGERGRIKVYNRFAEWIEKKYGFSYITRPVHMDEVEWIFYKPRVEEQEELNELFEKLPDIDVDWWISSDNATVAIGDTGTSIIMKFSSYAPKSYTADIQMKDRGKASAMEVFLGATKAIGEFIKKKKPNEMAFYAADMRRAKIYKRLLSKYLDVSKWDFKESEGLPFMRDIPALFIKQKSKKEFEIEKYE